LMRVTFSENVSQTSGTGNRNAPADVRPAWTIREKVGSSGGRAKESTVLVLGRDILMVETTAPVTAAVMNVTDPARGARS